MILGGATDGDSELACKAHGRAMESFQISCEVTHAHELVISFGLKDLQGIVTPHSDALVVTATIANNDVARIFIDTSSSVNVLFKEVVDQMMLNDVKMELVATSLYGFMGHALRPLGQVTLPLSMGCKRT